MIPMVMQAPPNFRQTSSCVGSSALVSSVLIATKTTLATKDLWQRAGCGRMQSSYDGTEKLVRSLKPILSLGGWVLHCAKELMHT